MPNRFQIKRTTTSGLLPNVSNVANTTYIAAGELAINLTDRKLLSSNGSATFEVGANLASIVVGTGFTLTTGNANFDSGVLFVDGTNNRVGVGTTVPTYTLEVNGSFAATTKSFVINHPTKSEMKLRYGSLEGPENGVYVRGRTKGDTIQLPDYWTGLVDDFSITVNLTPIGSHQKLYVKSIDKNVVTVGGGLFDQMEYFYTVFAERKDVDKLIVEI
jgi:hypothetical protein